MLSREPSPLPIVNSLEGDEEEQYDFEEVDDIEFDDDDDEDFDDEFDNEYEEYEEEFAEEIEPRRGPRSNEWA